MNENLVTVRVWGDYACFTRPEMKVERVSYPLLTPSAARGLLEALFWEPQMLYLIDTIRVVKRGQWTSFRRNEVTTRISLNSAKSWMSGTKAVTPIQAGGGAADGTQRNMLILQDVEYIITAEIRLTELASGPDNLAKYRAELERRAQSGKCWHRPCLGVREFACDFAWESDPELALSRRLAETGGPRWTENLGLMLYDVFAPEDRAAGFQWLEPTTDESLSRPQLAPPPARRSARGPANARQPTAPPRSAQTAPPRFAGRYAPPTPMFFRAAITDSVLRCHPERVALVRRNGGVN